MISGSAFVSTMATTGMPRRRASFTAFCSRIVSITTKASGNCDISIIPSRLRRSFAAAARDFLEKFRSPPKLQDGLVQIDDVNLIALFEDERLHLRIPTLRLVSKMDASFQQFRY